MKVVRGKQVVEVDADGLAALFSSPGCEHMLVDVGAGDGRAAYAYAREHPNVFVTAIDSVKENMRETSHRACRKPQRGGMPNVVYVWAHAEEPPAELAGQADEVWVTLPWGRLLDGLALGESDILGGLAFLARPGARVRVVLNCEVWGANIPVRVSHLPELTPEYARDVLADRYAAHGLRLVEARMLTRDETRQLRSPWAKRLHASRDWPRFLAVEIIRTVNPTS